MDIFLVVQVSWDFNGQVCSVCFNFKFLCQSSVQDEKYKKNPLYALVELSSMTPLPAFTRLHEYVPTIKCHAS